MTNGKDNFIFCGVRRNAPQSQNFLIDGFIPDGVVGILGLPTVGKTMTLIPLLMHLAGLHPIAGMPIKNRRRILYLAEDIDQVERAVLAIQHKYGLDPNEVNDWFLVADVVPVKPEEWESDFFKMCREDFFASPEDAKLMPLVVIDDQQRNFDLRGYSEDSGTSAVIDALKIISYTRGGNISFWLIGNTPLSVSDFYEFGVDTLKTSSFFTNMPCVLGLYREREDETVTLKLIKSRFEPTYRYWKTKHQWVDVPVVDYLGEKVIDRIGEVQLFPQAIDTDKQK